RSRTAIARSGVPVISPDSRRRTVPAHPALPLWDLEFASASGVGFASLFLCIFSKQDLPNMSELTGNCLIGQSGGPTAVINASVAGAVTEALNHECIEEIYGCLNGVLGILNEDFIDLA